MTVQITPNLKIDSLVSPEAKLGWSLDLFELSQPVEPHYHKVMRQIVVMVEGELEARVEDEVVTVGSGGLLSIDPGIVHALTPKGTVRFFAIDFPGMPFPQDVYRDTPRDIPTWHAQTGFPPLEDFATPVDQEGYSVHDLLTEKGWSVALLEIEDSPRHYHRIEKEIFVVVNGKLDLDIEGTYGTFVQGDAIVINPGSVHQLKSATDERTGVLCFNFPAFDPADMHMSPDDRSPYRSPA